MHEILKRVAERTLRFDMTEWFWGDAIAVDGLLEAAELLGEPRFAAVAISSLERWARRFLDKGPRFTDHLTPGAALVRIAGERQDALLLEAARRLADYLHAEVPRAQPSGAPLYRPDDPAYRHVVWVDTLYHEPSFFAALWQATGEERFADMALDVVEKHRAVLYDRRQRLLPQAVDTATDTVRGLGWGRGHGWALLGLADTLAILPEGQWNSFHGWTQELAERLLPLQDSSGFWRTLLHDREAYLETSTATFFSAAFFRLVRSGAGDYRAAGEKALLAALDRIDEEGKVWGVSAVTWAATSAGTDALRYKSVPTEFNLWGQGSALRMLAEGIRLGITGLPKGPEGINR
ncbi:MAG: glycoside hydrolase family 88 protein [Bradyrhizobiaceae bacterium]|nr:glycoside hydrolase family 88 protein [Bradyrhizobiaceae bacterium]